MRIFTKNITEILPPVVVLAAMFFVVFLGSSCAGPSLIVSDSLQESESLQSDWGLLVTGDPVELIDPRSGQIVAISDDSWPVEASLWLAILIADNGRTAYFTMSDSIYRYRYTPSAETVDLFADIGEIARQRDVYFIEEGIHPKDFHGTEFAFTQVVSATTSDFGDGLYLFVWDFEKESLQLVELDAVGSSAVQLEHNLWVHLPIDRQELHVGQIHGGGEEEIPIPSYPTDPVISLKGDQILFTRRGVDADVETGIWSVDLDSREVRRLTDGAEPVWIDEARFVFGRSSNELWLYNLETGHSERLVRVGHPLESDYELYPNRPVVSADGTYVAWHWHARTDETGTDGDEEDGILLIDLVAERFVDVRRPQMTLNFDWIRLEPNVGNGNRTGD